MKVIDIVDHFSPLDRSTLDGRAAYIKYFYFQKKALNALLSSFHSIKSKSNLEVLILKRFGQQFLNSIEALSLKYTLNKNDAMLVDLSDSGFPNFIEFKKLADDIDRRSKELEKLDSKASLKQSVLDHLLKKKTDPKRLLHQLGKVSYFSALQNKALFLEHVPGDLVELKQSKAGAKIPSATFLYSWASFDAVLNRPFIYLLIFENLLTVNGKDTDIRNAWESFKQSIRKSTNNTSPLKVVALDIDALSESILPKILKRMDIGPVYSQYAKDEHHFNQMLHQHYPEDFIFTYHTEIVFSVGEKKERLLLKKDKLRQIFFVDESNKECMEKMISDINKYMITSHQVLQHLNDSQPEVIKKLAIPVYVYKNK